MAIGASVLDFGIAARVGDHDRLSDGSIEGTPAYLAPERLTGEPVGTATDLYSLGVLLYLSLTGRLPWGGRDRPSTPVRSSHAETGSAAIHVGAARRSGPALHGMC